MNETPLAPPEPDEDFDPGRLRTVTDIRRSSQDRMLGGVCAGAARHLGIDPVIVRVVIAVLALVGFAGVILYGAAWLLLPADDADRSIAARWFNLDKNEEQVRVGGLILAAAIAVLSLIGDNAWGRSGAPWILVPFGLLYYFIAVRPRRSRAAPVPPVPAGELTTGTGDPYRPPVRERRSRALTALTVSLAAIAVALTRIYAELNDGVSWPAYVAVALVVVAAGLLVGTLFGHGGPLIAIGLALTLTLAVASALPVARIGAQTPTPLVAAQVDATYEHGVGLLELDLTGVGDPDALLGRTVRLKSGIGQTRIVVPAGLNVAVDAHSKAGEIALFERRADGTDNRLTYPADDDSPALTIDIDQTFGYIEVVRP